MDTTFITHQPSHINCYFSVHGKKLKIKFKQTDLLLLTADQVAMLTARAMHKLKKVQAICHLQGKVPPSEVSIPVPSSMLNKVKDHSDHTYCSKENATSSTTDKGMLYILISTYETP